MLTRREADGWRGDPLLCARPPCSGRGLLNSPVVPWLVPTATGGGVLFRADDGRGGELHWLRLSAELEAIGEPIRVGDISPHQTGFGAQPRAIAFDDGQVVAAERPLVHDGCRSLRVFREDGTDAHDGPWKLPCSETRRDQIGAAVPRRLTRFLEIERIAGRGALLVHADARNERWGDETGPSAIRAALVTSRGQRGSVPMVVDESVSATSSFFSVATEGADAVVAWRGDGVAHVRRLRCSLHE